jgi:predicted ATPase
MKGQRQFVLVTGAVGIGKTALVDAFVAGVTDAHIATVARGQCVEGVGSREEYYPVMEALSQLCASPDGERACRILARMAPRWLPAIDNDASQGARPAERMPGDLCAALEELAMDSPLLLVFEDLHWADHATCSLISALARRRANGKLMVLATYRPQDGTAEQALKGLRQDLLLRRLCVDVELAPLGKTQVGKLVSRQLGQAVLPPGLDEFVYQRSEGNPLFVIAMVEHLIAEGYLVREQNQSAAMWRQKGALPEVGASVPSELARMIEVEIERLCAKDQRLLEAASLIPVAFPAWAVAAALAEDIVETEEACDELARRLYFVQRAGQEELPDGTRSAFYVFAHGLYREVLYQRQSASRRARRHVRIAERLKAVFAGREHSVAREVAGHYEAAGDWHRAVQALWAAAQQAAERGAHAEAAALREQARSVAENLSEADRAQVLTGLHVLKGEMQAERNAPAVSESL